MHMTRIKSGADWVRPPDLEQHQHGRHDAHARLHLRRRRQPPHAHPSRRRLVRRLYDARGRQNYLHANNTLALAAMFFTPHGAPSALGRTGIATWLGYDAVQRPATLTQAAYAPAPAATDVAFSYARNSAGQIATIARDNDAYAWTGAYTHQMGEG